jgi:DNA-binding MurR/RpiR family transcriptional regulator
MEQVERVVEALHSCNSTFIFGVGASGLTAEEMKHKLMRIGMRVDALTNNHFMYMQAALLKAGDVAIGISHSGHSPETTHALSLAKQAGAITVALTHNLGSPLSKVADITLINGNRQGRLQGDSIGTKTAQLFVLDLIYTLLVQKDPEAARAINCARWMLCPRSSRASFVRFITICYSRFSPCRYPVATGMVTF